VNSDAIWEDGKDWGDYVPGLKLMHIFHGLAYTFFQVTERHCTYIIFGRKHLKIQTLNKIRPKREQ